MQFFRLFMAPDKGPPGGGDPSPEDEMDYPQPPPPPAEGDAEANGEAYDYDENYPPLTPSQEKLYYPQEGEEGYEPMTPSQERLYYEQEGYEPMTPSQEELYYQQQEGQEQGDGYPAPMTPSQEAVYGAGAAYEEEDEDPPPAAHQFVVGAGYGEPEPDEQQDIQPVEGLEHSPLAASDPKYQQLSVGKMSRQESEGEGAFASSYPPPPPAMEFADPTSSSPEYGEMEHEDSSPFAGQGHSDGEQHPDLLPDHDDHHDFGQKPSYRSQLYGEPVAAVDEDGIPRYIPTMPVAVEEGVLGRRIAGIVWILFGAILGMLVFKAGVFSFGTLLFAPIVVVGLLLATGAHWAGTMAMIFAVLYFLIYNGAGYMCAYSPGGLGLSPMLAALPREFGIALMWFGFLLPIATLTMILGNVRMGRAVAGALLMIIPAIGLSAWLSVGTNIFRPKLTEPKGTSNSERLVAESAGYSFTKPSGWVTYEWAKAKSELPIARGLDRVPNFFFLNSNQDMMLALYIDEAPRKTIAGLLGQNVKTPIESELSRGLPLAAGSPSAPYFYKETEFVDSVYSGTTSLGARIAVTVAKGSLPNRTLLVSVTRDLESSRTDSSHVDDAINAVIGSLDFAEQ